MTWPKETYDVFQKIASTCEREALIPRGSVVVAGVSGGVDSMLMLAFLDFYRVKHDFYLLVCHLNHMIRGEEADLDEQLVESYCLEYAIPYISVRTDIPRLAKEQGISLEQAGRIARRETMTRLGMEYAGAPSDFRVAFAHHMDDRAESILMHIGRGSGLNGLVGIRYIDGVFIRPLLDVRLAEIESAAGALKLPWREDSTNLSDSFLRNRVRLQLLPTWEEVLGYDLTPVLIRLGDSAESDESALNAWAKSALHEAKLPDGKLSITSLAELPKSIVIRVLSLYYMESTGSASLGAVHLEDLYESIEKVGGGDGRVFSHSLPGGMVAKISEGRLSLCFI